METQIKQVEIKAQRARLQFTQDDLAKKVGVSRQTIHAIESGKSIPETRIMILIARALNKTVEELFKID